MNMLDIFKAVKSLAENDQSIPNNDITSWVDSAIDRINVELQCNIPKTVGQPTSYVPLFDARFHESLVVFSVAKYRESDSDYNSAQYFLNTFNDMVKVMQRDMIKTPSTRVDYNVQQITVTNLSLVSYELSIPSGSYYDPIIVYVNDAILSPSLYSINQSTRTLLFKGVSLSLNDTITIEFENNSDLNNPPYQWWDW